MRLIYVQSTGELIGLPEGKVIGYSGQPPHVNSTGSQGIHGAGPIPRGLWKVGAFADSSHMGPLAIELQAADGTETFGRTGFFVHGDSASHPGFASHGCIILPRGARQAIVDNAVTEIEVVENLPPG